ncbi:MAG TPA: hypothetical protein VGV38_05200, partial [Pyrinomonadaceae bacterium]|nr:hypothetical protein [Pyrinomonadaceae bacterium]
MKYPRTLSDASVFSRPGTAPRLRHPPRVSVARLALLRLFSVCFVLSAASVSLGQQPPDLTGKRLGKIEVAGANVSGPEEVVKASWLSLGQPVSIEELDSAAGR